MPDFTPEHYNGTDRVPLPSHRDTVLIVEIKGVEEPVHVRVTHEGFVRKDTGELVHPALVQHFVICETPPEKSARTEALYLDAERQRAMLLS